MKIKDKIKKIDAYVSTDGNLFTSRADAIRDQSYINFHEWYAKLDDHEKISIADGGIKSASALRVFDFIADNVGVKCIIEFIDGLEAIKK